MRHPPPGETGDSHGDTRGKAVPRAYPHTLDRGGYLHRGRGQKPPPVSDFNIPASPTPPMHSEVLPCAGPFFRFSHTLDRGGYLHGGGGKSPLRSLISICRHPPPLPCIRRPSPTPALSSGSPIHWTVGGILLWGRGHPPPLPYLCFQYAPTTNANVISRSGANSHRNRRRRAFLHRLYRSIREPPRYR